MDTVIILLASMVGITALMIITVIIAVESAKQTVRQELRRRDDNTIDVTPKRRR